MKSHDLGPTILRQKTFGEHGGKGAGEARPDQATATMARSAELVSTGCLDPSYRRGKDYCRAVVPSRYDESNDGV